MSNYNAKTGLFELTFTRASYWARREYDSMEEIAAALRDQGIEVVKVHSAFVECRAKEHELFAAMKAQRP